MIDFTLQQVIAAVNPSEIQDIDPAKEIHGASIDSRKIAPGMLFVPIRGSRVNGHDFVVSCIGQGAAAALWEADQPHRPENVPLIIVDDNVKALQALAAAYRQSLDTTFIGVTGSSGKTTTKDIIASVAAVGYPTQKTSGNQNNEIGLPLTILQVKRATKVAVVEMGIDDFGQMDELTKIVSPDVAVITSIAESHIDHFGSLPAIVEEKFRITRGLSPEGLFLYNAEAPLLAEYVKAHPLAQRTESYGLGAGADLCVTKHCFTTEGLFFRTNAYPDFEFHLDLLGEHEIANALAAILCGISLGLVPEEIQRGFDQIKLTGMREEITRLGQSTLIDGTYNANPGSVIASVKMLADYPLQTKKIAVLGDMFGLGDKSEKLHRMVGRKADFDRINELWTIGQYSDLLAKEARGRCPGLLTRHFASKLELAKALRQLSAEPDLILIKASRAVALDEVVKAVKEDSKQ